MATSLSTSLASKDLISHSLGELLVCIRHFLEIQFPNTGINQIKLALIRLIVHIRVKGHHAGKRLAQQREDLHVGAQADSPRIRREHHLRIAQYDLG